MLIYRAKRGDTLFSVARAHGVMPTALAEANGLPPDGALAEGQALLVRMARDSLITREGDEVCEIARRHRLTPTRLRQLNPALGYRGEPYPGMRLTLRSAEAPLGTLSVLGYLHAATDPKDAEPYFPYLSYLAVRGATLTPSGELIPPEDSRLGAAARAGGVLPLLAVTTETGEGLGELLLGGGWERGADLLDAYLREEGYGGVLLELYRPEPAWLDAATAFLCRLRHRLGHTGAVLASLPPPKGEEDSVLAAYRPLGRAALALVSETNAFGSRFLSPSPAAPYDRVKAAATAAASQVRPGKLSLGISTRGEEFSLSGGEGRVVPPGEARALLSRAGATGYDAVGRVPYLCHCDEGGEHILFFEDAESLYEKLQLVGKLGIGGIALHPLCGTSTEMLLLIAELFRIVRPYGA